VETPARVRGVGGQGITGSNFHGKKQLGGRKGVRNDAFSSAEHGSSGETGAGARWGANGGAVRTTN